MQIGATLPWYRTRLRGLLRGGSISQVRQRGDWIKCFPEKGYPGFREIMTKDVLDKNLTIPSLIFCVKTKKRAMVLAGHNHKIQRRWSLEGEHLKGSGQVHQRWMPYTNLLSSVYLRCRCVALLDVLDSTPASTPRCRLGLHLECKLVSLSWCPQSRPDGHGRGHQSVAHLGHAGFGYRGFAVAILFGQMTSIVPFCHWSTPAVAFMFSEPLNFTGP
jgi:hypothetical protein